MKNRNRINYFHITDEVKKKLNDIPFEAGDILFQYFPGIYFSFAGGINGVTRSCWTHCGMVVPIDDDHKLVIAQAGGDYNDVHYTAIDEWILGSDVCAVGRLKEPLSFEQKLKLGEGIAPYLGKPYDFMYASDDKELYCSELINKVFERTLGIKLGFWQELRTLNWLPYSPLLLFLMHKLPLHEMMISPESIYCDEKLDIYRLQDLVV